MKRPEPLLRRLLFPGGGWAALAAFAAVASLWTVFSNGWEDAPAARAAYAFSAYALVVAICRAVAWQPGVQKPLSTACPRCGAGVPTPRCARLFPFAPGCASIFASPPASCTRASGFRSPWFGAAAVYYTVLSTMRFAVLRGVRNAPPAGRLPLLSGRCAGCVSTGAAVC